jgi:hypothetical protein
MHCLRFIKCKNLSYVQIKMLDACHSLIKRPRLNITNGSIEMDLTSILKQSGAIGVNEQMAEMGAAALLPSILGGFKKTAQAQPSGLDGLGGLLGQLGGGGLFDSVVAPEPTPVDQGNDILGQIFGSKDVSRSVAGHAATQTGIDPAMLKKMLPILAMLVAGYMAKQSGGAAQGSGESSGGLGGLLGGLLGGGGGQTASAGGLGSLLDMNGDGNPLDDIIGMAGKMMR